MIRNSILIGDCLTNLRTLPDCSVHCVVTSPPYWGLRDYGVDGQLGLEGSPEEYVANMVEVFREVRRVLRNDGTLWLNLGDSYAGGGRGGNPPDSPHQKQATSVGSLSIQHRKSDVPIGLKPKDLVGIPWRVAFALQADGWYLRQDIIWCLSGGTWLYVRTQKGDMPMTVKDLARLNPATVKLWNGHKWTQLLGMSKSRRQGDELEIILRSGDRISCTPTHKFPTNRGLVDAGQIVIGDRLKSVQLPEPAIVRDCVIDEDAAWFAGLYLAEGSRTGGTKIQLSGHVNELERWDRVQRIAKKFGGSATITSDGNNQSIRVYGKVLNAIVDELVSGRTAKDKCFSSVVWRYSNNFIAAMVDGYLSGDSHRDGNRWRLGFCRNYNLERDLRTACARLGYSLTLKPSTATFNGKIVPSFRGELRKARSGHHNEKDRIEVVAIRKAKCRYVYDLGVEDKPHLFALASGVLTHNSKPNPMPESVRDRCTKSHEYLFLLSKSERYYFDGEAIAEPLKRPEESSRKTPAVFGGRDKFTEAQKQSRLHSGNAYVGTPTGTRNRRSVWHVSTQSYKGAHFATFPPRLIEPCILAGTSAKGCCPACGKPWERITERTKLRRQRPNDYTKRTGEEGTGNSCANSVAGVEVKTTGWQQSCRCEPAEPVPCIVADIFGGSGTTGLVAAYHGRDWLLFELNPEYAALAEQRIADGYTPPKAKKPKRQLQQAQLF